ncbi:hypothetical protein BP6252_11619 [Coleophoma cylindrospora]|uniref:Extracellular membrane protein CFEM domain-containing protein n=1 Tax=Coleophoma cylindrospora TaxID=1849047 RepID=A0A3D8QK35_9HELO|nr:hypothetical protein BP6252_11619 [Coleophoma cylindrospora]
MKISSKHLVLLITGVYGVAAREALYTDTVISNGEGSTFAPRNNYNGWVNPEDLASMPQCIAQQNQSTWLSTMTKCTSKQCTSHFAFFCTHHQWLTQLSCLSMGFSSNVIEGYLPYCSRSVLAKAQLYLWIRNLTGRTWLVDIGDTIDVQSLTPASLTGGYAAIDVIHDAPKCLTSSVSALSMEPFQYVLASCGFTSTAQHYGNADRPWEYSESLQAMTAPDFETVGYDLTQRSIRDGNYFDKECFCNAFTLNMENEPCSGPEQLDLTRERLWMNATCGSTSLPNNWTDILKTTEFTYIPTEDWHWPMCIADIPKQVIKLTDQCATDACEIDSSGYCKVKRTVYRACFCRNIRYDSCGGSCQIFETRIDYVKWLYDLCGNLQDWHGLPDNWRQLAAPTPLEMIPWQWTLKPSNNSKISQITRLGSTGATATCASNEWKLRSFALVNIATLLAVFLSQGTGIYRTAHSFLSHRHPWWVFKGTLMAALQLLASWFSMSLVQETPGYEDVPSMQLMLLWCTIPRLSWLTLLLTWSQPFEAMDISEAASFSLAEMILQFLISYYMVMTVNYGREHNFYFGGLEGAARARSAKFMYAGALMWLVIIGLALIRSIRATRRMNLLTGSSSPDLPKWQRGKQLTPSIIEDLTAQSNERCTRSWVQSLDTSRGSEEASLMSSGGGSNTAYGTFSIEGRENWVSKKAAADLHASTVIAMFLLWIAQWFFWSGFIGLSSEEFCPPKLKLLTAVWIAFSLASTAVGVT